MAELCILSELQRLLLRTPATHTRNMPTPEEEERRKALKQAVRQGERDHIRSTLPIPAEQMRALFDFVDQKLSGNECDNRLTHTLIFLGDNQLPVDQVVRWLQDAGGYCDCEVLANAEEKFLFAFPRIHDTRQ